MQQRSGHFVPGIARYIEQRLRRPVPCNCNVVAGSTPVLSFGPARIAQVATLGLNPSRIEFLDDDGCELTGGNRRLATHVSLHTTDLVNAHPELLQQIVEDCNAYFQRNPYRRWFDQLERVLQACGASYYDGSACHLDLVQWATDPTWRHLDSAVRANLLAADGPFLVEQLRSENLQLLLVNGMGVIRQLFSSLRCSLKEQSPITINGVRKARIFCGEVFGRVFAIGWSTNLQSSFGVTSEFRSLLAERVGLLASEAGCCITTGCS